ncbi:sensor domain-containing protein [Vibrio furnissii]|uniref:sensor domain-containing protein n=2 Tax=Vibrio TaxID=662 RepID=UPI001EECC968|nr:GGDEF domain-containing phosphodiesterase [Vibrio furnissii]MCG6234593.1 EAL domain-containing protein [Vibrio furnissii]MCG6257852.1 EAL domain-containing protein [Vibrio furnissii]
MSLTQEKPADVINMFSDVYQKRLMHIFDVFSEGIFHMDEQGCMTFYNPGFYQQFGFNASTITLNEWFTVVHPQDREALEARVHHHVASIGRATAQYRARKSNGQYVWIEGTAVTCQRDGETFMVGSHRDISDQKLMESYLNQAAFYDNVSGLANATKLLKDIDQIKLDDQKSGTLLYIQIDDIKSYLNQYGTEVVQHILHHLISALNSVTNPETEFYRVRSDDFALLLSQNISHDALTALCHDILDRYAKSAQEHGHLFGDSMSIGVYPEFSNAYSAEQIINIASRTCQYAGEKKRSRIEIYNGKTQRAVDRFFYIERGLKEALQSRSLSVKFQPILNAQSGQVSSFEALVRWRSKEFGEIFPDEFIPVAEEKGLITDLGYQVFEKACEFISRYNKVNGVNIRVNINVSVLQLLNSTFPSNIKMMASEAGIDPQSIVLELTETVILDGNKNALNQLETLSKMGFQLSLDDFGTGFSSIHSFFDLPLNQIKIDRSMATKTLTNQASEEYLSFIIQLSRSKGVDIVIEGIENSDMFRKFRAMGASYLQGYWFSKPLSLASASRYTLSSNLTTG